MSIEPLVTSNVEALQLGLEMIDCLDKRQYSSLDSPVSSASVGSHVRHIVEHYQRFFVGLESASVDYDERARAMDLESDRGIAAKGVSKIIESLTSLSANEFQLDSAMQVKLQTTTLAENTPSVSSTIGRELIFLHGHTTHHFAQVALQLRAVGVAVPRTFGMAPSTQSYEAGLAEASVMAVKEKC